MSDRLYIFDTTLRDGEQVPGCQLNTVEKIQVARQLQSLGVEKPGLNVAGGAIGIGEITSIPTAPAIADAYYRLTGEREFSLPLQNTPYAPKK